MPFDGSALDWKEMAAVLRRRGCKVGPGWEGFDLGDDGGGVFGEVLSVLGGGRPAAQPAVLADGRGVDLPRLYRAVMGLGGYRAVGDGGRWGEVGVEVGFGGGAGPALKLVYAKYLRVVEEWAKRNGKPEVENGVHGGENGGSCLQSKRKREEHGVVEANGEGLKEMLEWVCGLAVDPCAPPVEDVISEGLREEMPLFVYREQAIRAREVLTSSRPGFLRTDQWLLQV